MGSIVKYLIFYGSNVAARSEDPKGAAGISQYPMNPGLH